MLNFWTNPLFYAQEALSLSEFVNRKFSCIDFVLGVPEYPASSIPVPGQVCSAEVSIPGQGGVNSGIIVAMIVFLLVIHLITVKVISSKRSKGEILVFPHQILKQQVKGRADEEKTSSVNEVAMQQRDTQNNEGVSGAGRTTLLDVLTSRVTQDVISGRMLVNDQIRNSSFQRKTGDVAQQDLNFHTCTVREGLRFSALPARYTRQ
ncbi:hypothetical protein BDV19DRAFT_390617 [Aspergillus venezuelensis]